MDKAKPTADDYSRFLDEYHMQLGELTQQADRSNDTATANGLRAARLLLTKLRSKRGF
jgi:hypothetical protein